MVWSFASHTIPIFSLYALLFVDAGMSAAQVSLLFTIWSVVGIVAEVPSGALADRFSRRGAIVAAALLQAAGHAAWVAVPSFAGFAAGFALWGIGSSLSSGSFESLLYDGLAASGAQDRYARVVGLAGSAALLAQIPAGLLAGLLYSIGGYALAGWSSVAICIAVAGVALGFVDHRGQHPDGSDDAVELGYFATLRAGIAEVRSVPALRAAALAVALVFGLDASEEYFPLQIEQWGVAVGWIPLVALTIPLGGAIGSAMTSFGSHRPARTLGMYLVAGAALLGLSAWLARPAGVAGIVVYYGLYCHVLKVAEARLQREISSTTRATATSAAALAGEIVGIATFGLWALGGLPVIALAAAVVGVVVVPLLSATRRSDRTRCRA